MTSSDRGPSEAQLGGWVALLVEAIIGVTDVSEAMHDRIAGPKSTGTMGIPSLRGFVYQAVRGAAGLIGDGLAAVLPAPVPGSDPGEKRPALVRLLAAANGVAGDHLAASGNPLAIPMTIRQQGRPLPLDDRLAGAMAGPVGGRLVLLVHGLCMSDLQWNRDGHDHGRALSCALGLPVLHLNYNSGLHVSTNGRLLAERLDALMRAWPVALEELVIITHSMGGLVSRSAVHYAGAAGFAWPERLRDLVFLGTPHLGAPLERIGSWIDAGLAVSAFSAPLAKITTRRSAGITDLRFGSLLDEDWQEGGGPETPWPVPLPEGVRCFALAGTLAKTAGQVTDNLVGDGLVPVSSALGRHADPMRDLAIPAERQWVGASLSHMGLLASPEIYRHLKSILEDGRLAAGDI